jgi:hypothetical protein
MGHPSFVGEFDSSTHGGGRPRRPGGGNTIHSSHATRGGSGCQTDPTSRFHEEEHVGFQDEHHSSVLKLIAATHQELAWFYAVLADPNHGVDPETPEVAVKGRKLTMQDIEACKAAGNAAKGACDVAGDSSWETCYAVGKIAEAPCLNEKLTAKDE